MRAAKNGDSAAIRLLLAHGADPNAVEKKQHHGPDVRRRIGARHGCLY